MKHSVLMLCATLCCLPAAFAEDLTCLQPDERARSGLYARLQQEAYAALDRRQETVEGLKTPDQIHDYQRRLKDFFVEQLGGFPEPGPLHAQTVRTIPADGYRIENVIFESQPGHHITANLYLPEAPGPFPGIVVACGHGRAAKSDDYNQRFGIMMAQQGMAAICYDPIGQGERSQILDDKGQPRFSSTTTEHFLIGVGSSLVGRNTARYRIWDAMRAVDYLVSRSEVDAQQIGMTGCSGGGTLTSYVMALDERVACAAPACYLTTFRRLIETIGPQDAEQNIFGQVAFGLDQPDYVILRAPRPTLISSTTSDFFDIQGSWENYRQAKRIYGRLGSPERVDLVEMDGKHGVQPQNLATIAHWMRRWLLDRDDHVPIAELKTRPESELLCTESGQVLHSPGEQSVFDLNAERERELAVQRQRLWATTSQEALSDMIRERLGVRPNNALAPPNFEHVDKVSREDYHIDKFVLRTDSSIPLAGLTFHPESPQDDAYLVLHDAGKVGDSETGGAIESLVDDGYAVVSIDLRGQGETGSGDGDELLGDWKTYFVGYLLGKPLVGMHVEDALSAGHFVAYYQKPKDAPRQVHLIGIGQAGIVALHAAALHPTLFASVTLRDTPHDWASVVSQDVPSGQLTSAVHGALEVYDLPDLVRLAGKDRVRYESQAKP